jgi:hypothetical protein
MSEESIDIVDSLVAAGEGPCWDGYKQVGMKEKNGKMVPNCVPVDASDDSEFAAKKRTISQTPAPKKDRVKGSSKNKKDSASGSKKIVFSKATENALSEKVKNHNEKAPDGRKATLGMLRAVYRRGAGAFSTSHRPGMNRNGWAMARVNAYLKLLKSGRPSNPAYKSDNDLLPSSHPRSSKKSASAITAAGLVPEEQELANALIEISEKYGKFNEDETGIWAGYTPPAENEVASIGVTCANCVLYLGGSECRIISLPVEATGKCRFAVIPEGLVTVDKDKNITDELQDYIYEKELTVELKDKDDYEYQEEAILAMTEFSGYGYEAETAIRASWLRGVRNGDDPFIRASLLASLGHRSLDGDLLPKTEESDEE